MEDQEEAGIDPAIEAALGFSSFGSKRRKHIHADIVSGSTFAVVGLPTRPDLSKSDENYVSGNGVTSETQNSGSDVNTRLGTTMIKAGTELQEKNSYSPSQMNESAPVGHGRSKGKELVSGGPVSFPNQPKYSLMN